MKIAAKDSGHSGNAHFQINLIHLLQTPYEPLWQFDGRAIWIAFSAIPA